MKSREGRDPTLVFSGLYRKEGKESSPIRRYYIISLPADDTEFFNLYSRRKGGCDTFAHEYDGQSFDWRGADRLW